MNTSAYLDTLVSDWLSINPWYDGVVKGLEYQLCNVLETRRVWLFELNSEYKIALVPGATAPLIALGDAWLDSLERQLIISKWGEDTGINYMGTFSITTARGMDLSYPTGTLHSVLPCSDEISAKLPKGSYRSYPTHKFGKVLFPISNL